MGCKRQHLLQTGITAAGGVVRRDGQWYNYFEKIRPVWRGGKIVFRRERRGNFPVFFPFLFPKGSRVAVAVFLRKTRAHETRSGRAHICRARDDRNVSDCIEMSKISNFSKQMQKSNVSTQRIAIPLKIRKGSTDMSAVRALRHKNTEKWRPAGNTNKFKTKGYAVIGLYLKKTVLQL